MEFTINLSYVFSLLYAAFKGFAAVWISKREFQYPIWSKNGVQIERGLHHKLQAIIRNFLINPEWGLIKIIAFGPVFLFTGKKYMHYFMPWKVRRSPVMCKQCGDKGKYFSQAFLKGSKGNWTICDCQKEEMWLQSEDRPNCECTVCLDKGTIGPNRSCPHCDRRSLTAAKTVAAVERDASARVLELAHEVQQKLDGTRILYAPDRGTGEALAREMLEEISTPHGYTGTSRHDVHACQTDDPYSYLSRHENDFCGDPYDMKTGDPIDSMMIREIQPTEVQVGDTIIIGSVPKGHRNGYYMGRSLRVMGVCLPFMVIEYDCGDKTRSSSRHIDSMDVRGMTLFANRKDTQNNGCCNKYQPLLNPKKLCVGDRFVISRLGVISDGSYRGHAFEVTQAATTLTKAPRNEPTGYLNVGDAAIKVRHLSWGEGDATDVWLRCEGLQIIPCDDQYLAASKTHSV